MKLLSLILIISLFSSHSFGLTTTTADGTICDWSKVVTNPDGTYSYSKELNLCVGKTVQDGQTKDLKIADLYKAVDSYQKTIATDEQRIQSAMEALSRISARVEKAESLQQNNDKLAFGLGVLTAFLAAEAAAKLSGH